MHAFSTNAVKDRLNYDDVTEAILSVSFKSPHVCTRVYLILFYCSCSNFTSQILTDFFLEQQLCAAKPGLHTETNPDFMVIKLSCTVLTIVQSFEQKLCG
jgi:hypothetical protein